MLGFRGDKYYILVLSVLFNIYPALTVPAILSQSQLRFDLYPFTVVRFLFALSRVKPSREKEVTGSSEETFHLIDTITFFSL